MNNLKWTKEKVQILYDQYLVIGATYESVAKNNNCTRERVRQLFAMYGFPAKEQFKRGGLYKAIVELDVVPFQNAATITEVAKALNASPGLVIKAFKEKGLTPPKYGTKLKRISDENKNEIISGYVSGKLTTVKIAEQLGTGYQTVLRLLRSWGVKIKSQGWNQKSEKLKKALNEIPKKSKLNIIKKYKNKEIGLIDVGNLLKISPNSAKRFLISQGIPINARFQKIKKI